MEERNLELIPRREGTREKVIQAIVKIQLSDIENIRYIRAQFHIWWCNTYQCGCKINLDRW